MDVFGGPPICLFAQAEAGIDRSHYYIDCAPGALGFFDPMIPLLGFATFVGAMFVVFKSRRPATIAAFVVFLPLPLLVAGYGAVKTIVVLADLVAMEEVTLRQSEIAGGLAEACGLLMRGLLATIPSYLVIAVGLFIRTIQAGRYDERLSAHVLPGPTGPRSPAQG